VSDVRREGRRALIVDDSRVMRAMLGRIISDQGFSIVEARDGRDALERIRALGGMDLIVVDWRMPGMSGLEFVLALRRDETFGRTPIVMVTSETDPEQLARAIDAGANEYVMKPFTRDVIVGKLELLGLAG